MTKSKSRQEQSAFYTKLPHKIWNARKAGIISQIAFNLYVELSTHKKGFWLSRQKLIGICGINKNNIKKAYKQLAAINAIKVKHTHNGFEGVFFCLADIDKIGAPNSYDVGKCKGVQIPTSWENDIPTRKEFRIPTRKDTNNINKQQLKNNEISPEISTPAREAEPILDFSDWMDEPQEISETIIYE